VGELQLFRFIRGIRRAVADKFDMSYAYGAETSVGSDPYGLQTVEFRRALAQSIPAADPVAFKALGDALVMMTAWAHSQTINSNDILTGAETLAAVPAIALAEDGPLPSAIDEIDRWLVSRRDAPKAPELQTFLHGLCTERGLPVANNASMQDISRLLVSEVRWHLDRVRLGVAFMVAMHRRTSAASIESRGRLTRLAMVASLIETLAGRPLTSGEGREIFELLHRRPLVIGTDMMKAKRRVSNLARRPGVADLLVIRQTWAKYVLGELAAVEPVMPGEHKSRMVQRSNTTESSTTATTTKVSQLDRENRATQTSEISAMLSTAVHEKAGVEGWLNVDAEMPTTKVSTHVGADYSYSSDSERESASRHASEIVEGVISRVEESLTVTREQRRTDTFTDRTIHKLENPDAASVNGVYRWVDRVNLVEVVKYPNRFVFEVQIPEPAAWVRWLIRRQSAPSPGGTDPGPFPNTLMVDLISTDPASPTFYLALGRQFGADALPTPPSTVIISLQTKGPDANDGAPTSGQANDSFGLESSHEAALPDGYAASSWRATVVGIPSDYRNPAVTPRVIVAMGAGAPVRCVAAGPPWIQDQVSGTVGPINRGTIPIAVVRHDLLEYVVNFEITCVPSAEMISRWQMDVLSELRSAHERRRAAFAEMRAREDIARATLPTGANPLRNREIMITELKRLSMEMLSDSRLRGEGGMDFPNATDAPILNRAAAREAAPHIQFMEQAFEWSNMSFVFYPTYWAVETRWVDLMTLEENDPEYAAFLRSGSARVIIPARPGFEYQAQLFVDYGLIWGGGAAPGPLEPRYVSIATEIEELQRGAEDGEVIKSWSVTLPTNMVALDDTGRFPMTNPDVRLP
jgi:hypothetical protein